MQTNVIDLLLVMLLGFLGSFGHCAGMCGPLTVAFALSHSPALPPPAVSEQPPSASPIVDWKQQLQFHLLLNLGRLVSYGLLGAAIGALGSVLVAGGQFAGIDSWLRQGMSWFTGILLIGFGISQVSPSDFPRIPLLHPLVSGKLHEWLSQRMVQLSLRSHRWTPALLGICWGLIPCGFLYAAQIKAAETGDLRWGAATMLAFGLGTLPVMAGVGVSAAFMSTDRRSQLFRAGGWVTIAIGALVLLRTSEMVDVTGYAALICLVLALLARPLSQFWAIPLRYRRMLGVAAFLLALAHTAHTLDHSLAWDLRGIGFMLPTHRLSLVAGFGSLLLLTPSALTSHDRWVQRLGSGWRKIHLLSVPALIGVGWHIVLIDSHFWGGLTWGWRNHLHTGLLGLLIGFVLLLRSRQFWQFLSLEKWYVPPIQPK